VALAGDALIEVALGDRARALRQPLDRHRDPARDVEADPRGGKEDDDRREPERDRVGGLDRLPLHLQTQVLVEGAADLLATLGDAVRHVGVDDHHRHRPVPHHHGRRGADHLGLANGVDDGRLLPVAHAADEVGPRRQSDPPGQLAPPAARDRLAAREHLDDVELVLGTALVDEPLERVAPFGRQQAFGVQAFGEPAGKAECRLPQAAVVGLRDLARAGERAFHLLVEPALDRVAHEHERDEEEERRRQERHSHERANQPRAEMGAHDAPPALEDELHDVPADQEDEQDQ